MYLMRNHDVWIYVRCANSDPRIAFDRLYDLIDEGLTLNLLKAEISYQGNKKALTKNELGILRLLMVNKGNIIPRDAIIDELWQSEQFIDENTLNVNVSVCCCCIAEPPGNHGWRGDFTACRR